MVNKAVLIEVPIPPVDVNDRSPISCIRHFWLLPFGPCLLTWFYIQPVEFEPVVREDAAELAGYARAKWGLYRSKSDALLRGTVPTFAVPGLSPSSCRYLGHGYDSTIDLRCCNSLPARLRARAPCLPGLRGEADVSPGRCTEPGCRIWKRASAFSPRGPGRGSRIGSRKHTASRIAAVSGRA